ncbi:MAG: ribonuclease PH [Alphaproteobacteria bacterium]|nr:MAG: ribonuclease PH [Alphaproteobacteria bacterium]
MRPSGRSLQEMRPVSLKTGAVPYAEGSCLITIGNTQVLCAATVEERTPPFLRNTGLGWVTAEYGMLPRATHQRTEREAVRGRQTGRTQEIQRLIGRSLRSVTDRAALGERQIRLDCDVLVADGGTRTAAITGSYVALHLACLHMMRTGALAAMPLRDTVAAISCGLVEGQARLDLDFAEDSNAQADANFVFTGQGHVVEVQVGSEGLPFSQDDFISLLTLGQDGASRLRAIQMEAIETAGHM